MSLGINRKAYKKLLQFGVPMVYFEVLFLTTLFGSCLKGTLKKGLVCAEFFCGVASIAQAFDSAQLPSLGVDILRDPASGVCDLTSPEGYVYATYVCLA